MFVAPFTGVWIETRLFPPVCRRASVAPFTGVWIETRNFDTFIALLSRALHGRVD